jgi:hypothetical protein
MPLMRVRHFLIPRFDRYRRRRFSIASAALLFFCSADAGAQLRVPGVAAPASLPTQSLPINNATAQLGNTLNQVGTELDSQALSTLRGLRERELIRRHSDVIEADPNGAPIVRSQILAIAPSADALAQLQTAGFTIVEQRQLAGLELDLIVLAPPPRLSTRAALRKLRALDPSGSYDFNHIYSASDTAESGAASLNPTAPSDSTVSTKNAVGLIDGGVAITHPVFRADSIHSWGCGGQSIPSQHGTAVASLLVGSAANFHGAAAGAPLYSADVYCNQPTGGALDTIAAACAWLTQQPVAVINISLVGPPNILLEQIVRNMSARGYVIVAAVGNDGPAAPPLYPAAYPDVIGVTGVDSHRRALIEAGRGAQVYFAAPGADMAAATTDGTYVAVRGTSFAAPIVAGLLASYLTLPDRDAATRALAQLDAQAVDLGAAGPDKIYGHGLVGEAVRLAPTAALGDSAKLIQK